jgi:S1-C subfamily serine protease
MAMGSPFGLDQTVTIGIVSAKERIIGSSPRPRVSASMSANKGIQICILAETAS